MSLMILAAMMMAHAPAAAEQAPAAPAPAAPVRVAKKQKPPQICEYIEVTGSRSKHRVCRDANGDLDLGPGVSSSLSNKGPMPQQSGSGSPGGSN